MKRNGCVLSLRMCAVLGIAACLDLMGGCPEGIFGLGGGAGGAGGAAVTLTVSPSRSGEATVDKQIDLTAEISNGTEPFTVQWTRIEGPSVTIANAATLNASFVPLTAGFYRFVIDVTDSSATPRIGSAEITVPVGDVQFTLQEVALGNVPGNPGLLKATARATAVSGQTEVLVYDPEFTQQASMVLAEGEVDPRSTTEMAVTYDVLSVPDAARLQDTTFNQSFGTITNNGLLVGQFLIQADPDGSFLVLTNLATTVENLGVIVPGDYVFRATVTNPNGVSRSRDLTVTVVVEGLVGSTLWGNSSDGLAISAGPTTVKVRELPLGSPGNVTDKVMQPADTAALTVTVFPSSDTSYRFFLEDNNGVAHPEFVTASVDAVAADGAPHDITLTIGSAGGLPIGTHALRYDTFDGYGVFTGATAVSVNFPAVPVRFHVTADFLEETMVNAALVGGASNDVDAPTQYEGWTGDPDPTGLIPTYGKFSALADVNLDGALDILSTQAVVGGNYHVRINVAGFRDGSTAALRHPQNNGNFGPFLPAPTFDIDTGVVVAGDLLYGFAVGDLNADGLPDFAVGFKPAAGNGQVTVYFHTGDPIQPYSQHADQTLQILPPETDRQAFDSSTDTLSPSALGAVDKTMFGYQVGIFDANGDDRPDLVVTDPKFAKAHVLHVALPAAPDIAPPAANTFYLGDEGRVYVFAGGANGELKPGRPALIASLITEREVSDGSAPVFPTNPVLSTTFAETNKKYSRAYTGAELDLIGHALSNGGDGFAVGSAEAAATGAKMGALQIVNAVADAETVTLTVSQPGGGAIVTRIYEFDTTGVLVNPSPPATAVTISNTAASNAITALINAINGDTAVQTLVTAAPDGARPERVNLVYAYGAVDGDPRAITVADTMLGVGNDVIAAGAFVQNNDGRVYRVAINQASGALTNPINGIQDSDMGFGEVLALGGFNDAAAADDLAVTALDPGTAAGVNDGHPIAAGADDGAVFVILDGDTPATLPAPISGVGATTLRSGGLGGTDLAPTAVGAKLAFGDVNGDGLEELFFSETGFDRIYLILGAGTPADSPDITFWGVTFDDSSTAPLGQPDGGSLMETGTFLFGDITGDTRVDWLFLDEEINFGFAGFER
jgi:hypothetical protein